MSSALKNFLHLLNISTQATEDKYVFCVCVLFMFIDVGTANVQKIFRNERNKNKSPVRLALAENAN